MNSIIRIATFFLLASSGASAASDFFPIIIKGDASSIKSINTDIKCLGE